MNEDVNEMDSPGGSSLFGRAEAAALAKLAGVFGVIGLVALINAVTSHSATGTFGLGVTIGGAVASFVLAGLLLMSAGGILRHLDATNDYWRAIQSRRRPRFFLVARSVLAVAGVVAVIATSAHSPFTLGLATVPGLLALVFVVGEKTGSIRPF